MARANGISKNNGYPKPHYQRNACSTVKVESRSVMLNLATVVPMEQAALFLIEKPQIAGNACVL